MKIKLTELKELTSVISAAIAVDKNITCVEINCSENSLSLSTTNEEYYVTTRSEFQTSDMFKKVINAKSFLDLVNSLSVEELEIIEKNTGLVVKANKSRYTLPSYADKKVNSISLTSATMTSKISKDILTSIISANGKEVEKASKLKASDLQHLYYLTNTGCFTFTTSACLNRFNLEQPLSILLNDRIVKLFKLFDSDVSFSFGVEGTGMTKQAKITLCNDKLFIGAKILNDELLLNKVQNPYNKILSLMNSEFKYDLKLSTTELSSIISRLLTFNKNSNAVEDSNYLVINATVNTDHTLNLSDTNGNLEVIQIEEEIDTPYSFNFNLIDLKYTLDTKYSTDIHLLFGNGAVVEVVRGSIINLIPQYQAR